MPDQGALFGDEKPARKLRAATSPADGVALQVYEDVEHMMPFMALRTIAGRALKMDGVTDTQVVQVMGELWRAGRPITLQTVGQALRGYSGRMNRTQETQAILERGMARAVQHEQARGPSQAVGW